MLLIKLAFISEAVNRQALQLLETWLRKVHPDTLSSISDLVVSL
jgi:hypothetical protein